MPVSHSFCFISYWKYQILCRFASSSISRDILGRTLLYCFKRLLLIIDIYLLREIVFDFSPSLPSPSLPFPTHPNPPISRVSSRQIDKDGNGYIDVSELKAALEIMCASLKAKDVASTFKKMVNKRENLETIGGMSTASSEGTTHSVRLEEQLAFSDWINSNLGHDPDLKHLLPIDPEGKNTL
ncbi:Plastin-1 [Armadillidium nasatum]|uniref:Plastin-1 n=1 Tax=Armadillidium nasatum TaxID=96803 RepID=A0A5N5TCF1_9CRUS|nr:Plastin-1 [Armadillidium nasatum]